MTPHHRLASLVFVTLLAACAAPAPVRTPVTSPSPPAVDYHLIMGELALARERRDVAAAEYALAAEVLAEPGIARRATLVAVHAGDRDAAHAAADRWETLAPDDLEAAQYQAVLHARSGDEAAAREYLLRIADGGGAPADAAASGANLQLITTLLAGEPNPWRAADLMAAVATARPQRAEGWYGAALLALAADRPAQAATFAERALARAPNLLDALFLRARAAILAEPGEPPPDALAPLAGLRNARDSGARLRYAGLLVLAGQMAEADALYEDILVDAPDQHDARMARALLAMDDGRLDVAEVELHRLLQASGRVQDAFFYLGVLAEQRGRPDDAIDWYARVAPEGRRWLDAQYGIGRVLIGLHDPATAQAFFAELYEQWPEYREPLLLQEAAVLTATGHPQLALQRLEGAREAASGLDRMEIDWQRALAMADTGDTAGAEAIYRRMLAADPGNPMLQNALGYLVLDQEDRREEAGRLLEAALAAAPANPAVLDSLGWLRHRQGRSAEARRLLEESWQRRPAAITGMHLLAALLAAGDDAAAVAMRRELRAHFPDVLVEPGEGS